MPQLHWRQLLGFNGVAFGVIGFILVGIVCLGSIGFGVYKTVNTDDQSEDSQERGLGQVLTVLGLYFSVPYLIIVGAFIYAVVDFGVFKRGAHFWTKRTTLGLVIFLYLLQQAFSDVYLVLLHGPASLGVLVADVIVLVMFFVWQLCPNTCVAYVLLFVLKMGLVWGEAYTLVSETVFGPSGFAAMLFLCIPIIQFSLFSPTLENEGISHAFVSRFNIAMTHLLHSLDIIAMFAFCFKPLEGGGIAELKPVPTPLRWLMMVICLVAFAANNLGVPFLFFRSKFRRLQLPNQSSSTTASSATNTVLGNTVSHRDFHMMADNDSFGGDGLLAAGGGGSDSPTRRTAAGGDDTAEGGGGGGGGSGGERGLVPEYNENEQMLAFMIMMLMMCDFPFLSMRFALWSSKVARMDVFAAKNIKAMLDVLMLLTRTTDS